MNTFEFKWKYGDFEIRSCKNPRTELPELELVKWRNDTTCFALAFFKFGKEGGDLHFVGNRPFQEIAEIDLTPIWKQLWLAAEMLDDWYNKEMNNIK